MTPDIIIRAFTNDQFVLDKVFYSNYYRIQELPEDCVVVDIGAHCGYFALSCAMKGAKRVYAYEPYKPNYETMLKNIAPFREQIIPFNQGVWSSNQIFKITHPSFEDSYYDFNKLELEGDGDFDQGYFVPFDQILASIPEEPTLLKLNTMNFDLDLLKSSEKIDRFKFICGEAEVEAPSQIEECINAMKEKGFEQSFFRANDEEGTNQFVFGKNKSETETIFQLYA